jgi:predicted lipoprotein with Yx(FWY)xxD motif
VSSSQPSIAHRPTRRRLAGGIVTIAALGALTFGSVAHAQSPQPMGEATTVSATTTDLGTFLTGPDGKTLYFFANDTAPGASVCEGDCVTNWPLFTVDAGAALAAGEGVTGVLATFTRADGTTQVSYDGRPLYYFAGDQAAGDTNGQGRGDVWFVALTDGSIPALATTPDPNGLVIGTATTDLGTFLVDADGRTLYVFTKDVAPGASVCEADCLGSWPALGIADGQGFAPADGVDGVLGVFARSDGSLQVSYDGRPLYYWAGDQAAGDTTGQGIGGVWFVALTDGSVPAPESSPAS